MAQFITPKQLEILVLLYRFRFLNRIHIQTILNHKDPKRINTWLKDLTNQNIIGRIYSTKLAENTKPAIYFLHGKSKEFLIHEDGVNESLFQRLYREKNRSPRFIDHNLILADFYLHLQDSNKGKLHFFTKTDLIHHPYFIQPLPDAYLAREKGKNIHRFIFEIIDEGTPRFALRKRIEQYIEYYDSNEWHEATKHPFPNILLFCPNEVIKKFLKRHITQIMEEEPQVEFKWYVATKDKFEWEIVIIESE